MEDKHYLEYISPECNLIEVETRGMILIGSNEGGGGNENYIPSLDPFGENDLNSFPSVPRPPKFPF